MMTEGCQTHSLGRQIFPYTNKQLREAEAIYELQSDILSFTHLEQE
jgi:hypothetical protein